MSEPFRKIVVGYDATPGAADALKLATVIAKPTGAELVIASVHPAGAGHEAAAQRQLGEALRHLPYAARPDLVPAVSRSVPQGLHEIAESQRADLVAVGRGHLDARLMQGAPCAIAVAPPGLRDDQDAGLRVIGVAYDGSREAESALIVAEALALRAGAALRIIGVLEPGAVPVAAFGGFYGYCSPELGRDALHDALEKAADSVSPQVRAQTELASGSAVDELVARSGLLDLLVTGSRGYGPLRRVLLGAVSAGLVKSSSCPVLVVPRGAGSAASDAEPAAARVIAAD